MPRTKRPRNLVLYEDHLNLIRSRVWSWHRCTGYPVTELMGVGHYSFMKAATKWNPDRGKFTTYLFRILNNDLQRFVTKNDRPPVGAEDHEEVTHRNAARDTQFHMDLQTLSEEAKFVVGVLFRGEYTRLAPHAIRQEVVHKMVREGWSKRDAFRAFKEIRGVLGIGG